MFGEKKLKALLHKALHDGWSDQQLALSCAVGLYVAFSPFPGAHTVLMLLLKWLMRLNFPVLFLATSVNNPWTMIPLYSLDYVFGYWIVHHVCGFGALWSFSYERIFGSASICIWSFLIGGNVLGIMVGGVGYFIARSLLRRFRMSKNIAKDCYDDCGN